ncbi:MAG: hypothetical protein KatS3mg031_0868 [Chitinophagales bacterium]|nr:MAG: hypothetical protein KatS3mg031_0868 [Chitinophagales bacterium]
MKGKVHRREFSAIKDFIAFMQEPLQKTSLLIALGAGALLFVILHACYPYPDTFPDTGAYIQQAEILKFGSFRPIGFSVFLAWTHALSESFLFFRAAQFVLHFITALALFYSVVFFFRPCGGILYYGLLMATVMHPAALYLTGVVMSDSLFISLTYLYLASLIWIVGRANVFFIVLNLVLIYAITQVRYTGLFYPVISALSFFLAYREKVTAALLSLLPFAVIGLLIVQTRNGTEKHIGVKMFSGFSGWQLANNALHLIPHIQLSANEISDPEIRFVHQLVLITRDSVDYPKNDVSSDFIWNNKGPLKAVLFTSMQYTRQPYLTAWYRVSPILGKYGSFLIKKYPLAFARWFLLINFRRLLYPDNEMFKRFESNVPEIAKDWFHLKGEGFRPGFAPFHKTAFLLPLLNLIGWILFITAVGFAAIRWKRLSFDPRQEKIFAILLGFVLLYSAFSVYAGPIVTRYLIPVHTTQALLIYSLLNTWLLRRKTFPAKDILQK